MSDYIMSNSVRAVYLPSLTGWFQKSKFNMLKNCEINANIT